MHKTRTLKLAVLFNFTVKLIRFFTKGTIVIGSLKGKGKVKTSGKLECKVNLYGKSVSSISEPS